MRYMNKIAERLFFDNWVRSGRMPSSFFNMFLTACNRSRLTRVNSDHAYSRHKLFELPSTSFTISRNTLIWIYARLLRSRPSSILEMGSGLSTYAHSIYLHEENPNGHLTTIDHDLSWLAATQDMLNANGPVSCEVNFYHAPIGGANKIWGSGYDLPENLSGEFDWLLIDGPPSAVGRLATLPTAWSHLSCGANIFLDDAARPAEQEAIRKWLDFYGGNLEFKGLLPLGNGLAWFIKTG